MSNSNQDKARLLGMPFGTANNKLRKSLLFSFAWQLGLRDCYRCENPIDNIDDFSIEHKSAWSKSADPLLAFFDLSNIAFSHLRCNTGAANYENRLYKDRQTQRREQSRRRRADPEKYEKHLTQKRERYQQRKEK